MFHFQNPVVDWPECLKFLPPGYLLKAVDNVQMLDEAKRRKSTIKTVLRHWYTAQVPDSVLEGADDLGGYQAHADYLMKRRLAQFCSIPRRPKQGAYGYNWLQIPGNSPDDNLARARTFFQTFIDDTFMQYAHNVDYVEEWNEYFGNNQPADEKQRFIMWSQAVAQVWTREYRTRPGLEHIRLILANTAVGNDIPVETAQAAVDFDCLLGYHAYWPTRFNIVPDDAWQWYEGRWTSMDATFRSHGLNVDWALTEAGPILFFGTWPRVTLGPNDGWRHERVHNSDVNEFKKSITLFMDRWREWNNQHGHRCSNPMLFTSGFSGWDRFQIRQPHLSDIADHVFTWDNIHPPPPPPPDPPPDPGSPRIQYPRVYNVLPKDATEEQAIAVFRQARDRSRETVGYSYDDAGLGALTTKIARLYGIPADRRQNYLDWFTEFYPGTHTEFIELPG